MAQHLTPGERVTLIKTLAARMASETLDDLQLTLRQFGLEASGFYGPDFELDMYRGAVSSIQDSSDQQLVGLHEFFLGETAPLLRVAAPVSLPGVWDADHLRLFVSHTSLHKLPVGSMKLGLAARGVDAFVAHQDIEPTRRWQDVIETALNTCDALLAWLTPDFPESRWTDQEVGFAVAQSKLVVPIRHGLDPYGFIAKYQGIQGIGKQPATLVDEVVDALASSELTAARMIVPAAQAFSRSGSYNQARATFRTLTMLPEVGWPGDVLDLLEQAASTNDQIRDGVYDQERLPDLVAAFVERRRGSRRG